MKTPVDLVFWDWNGTLLDDTAYTLGCLNWLLEHSGYAQRYDLDSYREIFGFPIEDYYRRAGFDFARHPYPLLAQQFMDHYNAGVAACGAAPQAEQTLRALRDAGKRQVILSACRRDYLIEQVSQRGLEGYFDELLGLSDIYGVSKVQLGLDWLRAAGLDPARCVMVGDTDHDAAVARAMGVRCILVAGGHHPRAQLEAACGTVTDSLGEVARLLLA